MYFLLLKAHKIWGKIYTTWPDLSSTFSTTILCITIRYLYCSIIWIFKVIYFIGALNTGFVTTFLTDSRVDIMDLCSITSATQCTFKCNGAVNLSVCSIPLPLGQSSAICVYWQNINNRALKVHKSILNLDQKT